MRRRTKNRHLPACVYLHHGAYYYVREGKWHPLGKHLPDALAAYARLREEPRGSMARLIDQAIAALEPRLKPSTRRQYRQAAGKLKLILQEFSPEQVKPKHVARIKLELGATPNMANRVLSVLRQVFDYALEHDLVESNPAVGIRRHREAKRSRLLTRDEYDAIYAKAGPRLQVIMELLRGTGQRVGDVLKIHRSDLTEDGIRFVQQKTGTKLVVRWTPALRAAVERAKGLRGNVHALTLFSNRKGKAPDYRTVSKQWADACRGAEIADARLHDLRALAITQTRREGKNPTALAGHSTQAQTVRYLRDRDEPVVDGPEY